MVLEHQLSFDHPETFTIYYDAERLSTIWANVKVAEIKIIRMTAVLYRKYIQIGFSIQTFILSVN